LHEIPAWLCSEQSDCAGDEGQIDRQYILAEQRLRDASTEQGGDLYQVRCRVAGACSDQDRYSVDAPVHQMPYLGRCRGFLRKPRHISEHTVEIELLLIAGGRTVDSACPQIARTGA
jgi:hypothetical protein